MRWPFHGIVGGINGWRKITAGHRLLTFKLCGLVAIVLDLHLWAAELQRDMISRDRQLVASMTYLMVGNGWCKPLSVLYGVQISVLEATAAAAAKGAAADATVSDATESATQAATRIRQLTAACGRKDTAISEARAEGAQQQR